VYYDCLSAIVKCLLEKSLGKKRGDLISFEGILVIVGVNWGLYFVVRQRRTIEIDRSE